MAWTWRPPRPRCDDLLALLFEFGIEQLIVPDERARAVARSVAVVGPSTNPAFVTAWSEVLACEHEPVSVSSAVWYGHFGKAIERERLFRRIDALDRDTTSTFAPRVWLAHTDDTLTDFGKERRFFSVVASAPVGGVALLRELLVGGNH